MSGFFAPDDISLEEWRPIKSHLSYEVSNLGRVKSPWKSWPHIMECRIKGYVSVCLTQNKKVKSFLVHRLVLEAFVGKCPDGCQANHKDGNKTNNRVKNLEWLSCGENLAHGYRTGLRSNKGELHSRATLKDDDVRFIKQMLIKNINKHAICKMFKIQIRNLNRIAQGTRWSHITL